VALVAQRVLELAFLAGACRGLRRNQACFQVGFKAGHVELVVALSREEHTDLARLLICISDRFAAVGAVALGVVVVHRKVLLLALLRLLLLQ